MLYLLLNAVISLSIFFYPEKFLSSAGWQLKKGVANLPQDENIKTYPLRSLFLVLCDANEK